MEPKGVFPPKGMGRLPGIDGNGKMSKSLGNGIYISIPCRCLKEKVMSMYTDPNHIHVQDPGQVEGIWSSPTWMYSEQIKQLKK